MSTFVKTLVSAAAAFASVSAFATVTLTDTNTSQLFTLPGSAVHSWTTFTSDGVTHTLPIGEFDVTGPAPLGSFAAYCFDPNQTLKQPGTYTISDEANDGISRLFRAAGFNGYSYATDGVNTNIKQVALQLAIWEVKYDGLTASSAKLDPLDTTLAGLDLGQFTLGTSSAAVRAATNSLLSAAYNLAPSAYQDVRFFNPAPEFGTNQALVTTVPEPSTYALMAACLGVVGLVARRKSSV